MSRGGAEQERDAESKAGFRLQNDEMEEFIPQKQTEEMTATDLTNTETIKMSEPEFRITIIRILAAVENRLESLSAEIKEVKNSMKLKML